MRETTPCHAIHAKSPWHKVTHFVGTHALPSKFDLNVVIRCEAHLWVIELRNCLGNLLILKYLVYTWEHNLLNQEIIQMLCQETAQSNLAREVVKNVITKMRITWPYFSFVKRKNKYNVM